MVPFLLQPGAPWSGSGWLRGATPLSRKSQSRIACSVLLAVVGTHRLTA
jgi:hypothetical protein